MSLRTDLHVQDDCYYQQQRLLKTSSRPTEDRIETQQESKTINMATWARPSVEYVKVNCDASLDIKMRKMRMGVIMRDKYGEALLAIGDSRLNVHTAEVVECQALWKAMQ